MAKPMNATPSELWAMRRDHVDSGDFSIITDTHVVWLSEQKIGEDRKQHIKIPRATFNRLIRWYIRDDKPVSKVRRGAR